MSCALAAAQQPAAPAAPPTPQQWIERLAAAPSREVVRELTALGPAALPVLHRALVDRRSLVVRQALFAAASLPAERASLRDPIRSLLHHRDLGIALAATSAWPAVDGRGHTLVADYGASMVIDIAPDGERTEVFAASMVMNLTVLPDNHLLVCAYGDNRVMELDAARQEVWSFADVETPSSAQRLPTGRTLIADAGNLRVIEVDADGVVHWSYDDDVRPIDAERLANGNTLISSYEASGCVEVSPAGEVIWQWPSTNVRDADRLLDGTTLLVLTDEDKVVLVAPDQQVVREWRVPIAPTDAELLANGHLVAIGNGCIVEWGVDGTEVWRAKLSYGGGFVRCGTRQ